MVGGWYGEFVAMGTFQVFLVSGFLTQFDSPVYLIKFIPCMLYTHHRNEFGNWRLGSLIPCNEDLNGTNTCLLDDAG